jgi:ribosomal protein L20
MKNNARKKKSNSFSNIRITLINVAARQSAVTVAIFFNEAE